MEENKKSEVHLTSAAAFVEGGIQEACDDACSICLEAFIDSDPSTLTSCKHEFHLQCILEWCQRSSQCPMCWQPISLKDPTSQELLEAVEQERSFRYNPSRNGPIFHHPTLGDFQLQHLPVGASDAELEERIIQHLAAAAAMGRVRHIVRREGRRNRSSPQGFPNFLVCSTSPNTSPTPPSPAQVREDSSTLVCAPVGEDYSEPTALESSTAVLQVPASASASSVQSTNQQGASLHNMRFPSEPSTNSQDSAGPSKSQSFSESLKSRFNAISIRYKESISRSTRGWRERLFSHKIAMADLGSEARGEVNSGIVTISPGETSRTTTLILDDLVDASVSEPLTREASRIDTTSISNNLEGTSVTESESRMASRAHAAPVSSNSGDSSVSESNDRQISESGGNKSLSDINKQASCAAGSIGN